MKAGDVTSLVWGLEQYLPEIRPEGDAIAAVAALRVIAELAVWAHQYIVARAEQSE